MSAARSQVTRARIRRTITRSGRRLTAGAAAAALALGGAVVVAVAGAPAAVAAPAGTKTLNYSGTMSTSGQNMWGAGAAAPAADQTTSLFDQTWNASGGFDKETNVTVDFCLGILGGCPKSLGTYGAKLTASTSGEIGLSTTVHGATGGSVGVHYPVSFGLTGPADDSFAPGDTVSVSTTAPTVGSGASITSVYPDFSSVSLDGKFGFHASASGEICVVKCASGSIFDVNLPSGSGTVASGPIIDMSKNDLLLIQGLGLAKCFGVAEGLLFGAATYPNEGNYCENTVTHQDNGYLAFPDVTLGGTTVGADNALSASGHDQYMVIPISAVAWIAKIADLPFGFPNLSASFDGVGVNYTTVQDILSAVVTRHQGMTFTPTVNLTLAFGESLAYSVRDASNTVVLTGTGSSATFPLGDTIRFAPSHALTVTPTLTIGDNTFTNHTYDTVTGGNQIQAVALSASIDGCCAGAFPGIHVTVGPLYDSGVQTIASANIELSNSSWTLGGFNAAQLNPFTITPDPALVPTARTVTPVEGAAYTGVVASYVDPDPSAATVPAADDTTAVVNWGDGTPTSTGTIAGTSSGFTVTGSHTYAEEGNYPVTVTTTDTDTPTLHAVANSHATVSDAALTVTAQPHLDTTEGAPSAAGTVVARFTDADPGGTASDYSATIDWGDGTSTSPGTVSAGSGGEFVVTAPTHTYAEEGTPTVTVSIADAGGASTVAHPPMTTADAALHSTGVTNGTQAGTNTPVLYWPGAGNAVVAHLTDDDPQGTPSDYTAVVHWGDGTQSGATVSSNPGGGFDVTGSHAYTDANLGLHTITIDVVDAGGSRTETTTTVLAYGFAAGGTFAVGDRTLASAAPSYSTVVTFWGARWSKDNSLSGGAPASFKGFVNRPPANPVPPAFLPSGSSWTTAPGSSSQPPATVPSYMLALVTGSVTQAGSTITSGSVLHWVIVRTDPGYGPAAGHTGTGTIVAVLN